MSDRDRHPRRRESRDYGDYEADEIQPFGVSPDYPMDRAGAAPRHTGAGARHGRFYGIGPKGYRRSDQRILEELSDRLMTHPDVDASDIEVRVEGGIITLSGTVPDRHQKRIAEFIADDIVGVDDVHNELTVRHGFWSRLAGQDNMDETARRERDATYRDDSIIR